ncbi:MAG TPA: TIGR02234 family membrane protein [Mycobacterium sp.]|nr:TIGR02234 family membrane protein [Mycobacterium sp.]
MTDAAPRRGGFAMRLTQLLLVLAAGGLWLAARLPWVVIRSFDGLGQPKEVAVSGAAWSTALLPLALLSLAAAIAAIAVRGWPLRVLAVLMAAASLAAGYLAISMWVVADVAARGADIADVPMASLLSGDRRYTGAVVTLAAALCILCGAALLLRSASPTVGAASATKYVPPATRRSMARSDGTGPDTPELSERLIWDALDEGGDPTDDPTDRPPGPDVEGR